MAVPAHGCHCAPWRRRHHGSRSQGGQAICPSCHSSVDQPFWGQRVYSLGVGSKPIPQKKLSADKLATAIEDAISNPDKRRKSQEIGKKIQREDGIGNAVAFIEEMVKSA